NRFPALWRARGRHAVNEWFQVSLVMNRVRRIDYRSSSPIDACQNLGGQKRSRIDGKTSLDCIAAGLQGYSARNQTAVQEKAGGATAGQGKLISCSRRDIELSIHHRYDIGRKRRIADHPREIVNLCRQQHFLVIRQRWER